MSAGDDAAFRRVSWAYEQLSGKREELSGPSTPWQARRPASPGAKAYHRDQQGVAKAMMAMQLAAAGKRADALELLLSASTGKLPGAGEKAALFVFDSCTAHSFSQQPVEHAKVCCLATHSGGEGGRCARCATRVLTLSVASAPQVAALWRWLLQHDAVDAQACEAWKWKGIRALRPWDFLEATRLAAERADDPGFARNVWRDMPS